MLDPARLRLAVAESRDDKALLRLLAVEAAEVGDYAAQVRDARVAAAKRLHDLGVPMTEIARTARMTDSYLARLVYAAGGQRRREREQ